MSNPRALCVHRLCKFSLLTSVILIVSALLHGFPSAGEVSRDAFPVGSKKQLFIDEFLIGSKSGVTLSLNPPVKTGERSLIAEHPWEELELGWATVLEDNGTYKMWYECDSVGVVNRAAIGESPEEGGRVANLCYAISRDGIRWQKPRLGIIDFRGSKQNNLVVTNFFGTVFLDSRETDGNRFKLAGVRRPIRGLEILASRDGLKWHSLKDQPVLSNGHFDTQNQIFWDHDIGKYVSFVRRWVGYSASRSPLCCRKVGRSETNDLSKWPEPAIVYGHDELDPAESDPYNASVVKYPPAASVYLMFPSAYFHYPNKKNLGPLDIQLATSRDGINWNRVNREPYVRLGIDGSFDDGSIYMTVGMLEKGNEIWMYYIAYDFLHGDLDLKRTRKAGVISRLVQRLDGFISADAAYNGGELTTIPIIFEGSQLSLNLDTGALGETQVEILDQKGQVIPGFSAGKCDVINGNYTSRTVSWKGKSDLGQLAGKAVKLRFVMRSTKLYAFQFHSQGR